MSVEKGQGDEESDGDVERHLAEWEMVVTSEQLNIVLILGDQITQDSPLTHTTTPYAKTTTQNQLGGGV